MGHGGLGAVDAYLGLLCKLVGRKSNEEVGVNNKRKAILIYEGIESDKSEAVIVFAVK